MSTPSLIIRRARRDDLEAILSIYREDPLTGQREARGESALERYESAFADIDANPRQLLLVADASGTVAGTVQVTAIQHLMATGLRSAMIEAFFIGSQHQGQGIGGRLLEEAEQWAVTNGCESIGLTSNKQRPGAHRFYLRHGFEATHDGFKKKLALPSPSPA